MTQKVSVKCVVLTSLKAHSVSKREQLIVVVINSKLCMSYEYHCSSHQMMDDSPIECVVGLWDACGCLCSEGQGKH